MTILRILPGAADELHNAAMYYEPQKPGLAKRFLETFDNAAQDIAAAPDMYSPIGTGYRRLRLRLFPYAIIYRQEHSAIVIVAVMHQKRRPGYWHQRESE